MTKVQAFQLRNKSKADLTKQLGELKKELLSLRVQKINAGNENKMTKIGEIKKSVARVNTVISHTRREQLRVFYKGKKYIPLDLRYKKTRAIRRRLTPGEAKVKTLKQQKKDRHFAVRKYAVKF